MTEKNGSKLQKVVSVMANRGNPKIFFRNQEAVQLKIFENRNILKKVAEKEITLEVSDEISRLSQFFIWTSKYKFSKNRILVQSNFACEITFENCSISALLLALRPPMGRFWAAGLFFGIRPKLSFCVIRPIAQLGVFSDFFELLERKHVYWEFSQKNVGGSNSLPIVLRPLSLKN